MRTNFRSEVYNKSFSTKDSSRDPSSKTMRPPCRQSDNLFNLEDSSKVVHKQIRIVRKQARPPSRHKSPPKALDLELPPASKTLNYIEATPMGSSTPMAYISNFGKGIKIERKGRPEVKKVKNLKPDSFYGSRAWSAKQSAAPQVNKRKLESSQARSNDQNPDTTRMSSTRAHPQVNRLFLISRASI